MKNLLKKTLNLCSVLLLTACVRIPAGNNIHDEVTHSSFIFEENYGVFYVKPINGKKDVDIIDTESFVKSPQGKIISIVSKPYQFDIDQKYDGIRKQVELFDDEGDKIVKLKNGVWQFNFVLNDNGIKRNWNFNLNISHWYYSPLIHGTPN